MTQIIITTHNGYWYMAAGQAVIRTPYSDQEPRSVVVAYVRRSFPDARITES